MVVCYGVAIEEGRGQASDVLNIVVLLAGDRQFGLMVDGINDTEEIVVKPLGQQLKGIPCFAGATIMGDGRVSLILDVLGIAQRGGVISEVQDRGLHDRRAQKEEPKDNRQTLLLFKNRGGGPMAIPLSMVARLEEFPRSALEQAGDLDVVQYRDQILPLIHLGQVIPTSRSCHSGAEEESETIHVVVYSDGKRNAGLVVDRILDIVEETIKVRLPSGRHGVQYSAVIQGRVTDMLHMEGIIRSAHPGFFDHSDSAEATV